MSMRNAIHTLLHLVIAIGLQPVVTAARPTAAQVRRLVNEATQLHTPNLAMILHAGGPQYLIARNEERWPIYAPFLVFRSPEEICHFLYQGASMRDLNLHSLPMGPYDMALAADDDEAYYVKCRLAQAEFASLYGSASLAQVYPAVAEHLFQFENHIAGMLGWKVWCFPGEKPRRIDGTIRCLNAQQRSDSGSSHASTSAVQAADLQTLTFCLSLDAGTHSVSH